MHEKGFLSPRHIDTEAAAWASMSMSVSRNADGETISAAEMKPRSGRSAIQKSYYYNAPSAVLMSVIEMAKNHLPASTKFDKGEWRK